MASLLVPPVNIPGIGGEAAYVDSRLLDELGRPRDLDKVQQANGSAFTQFMLLDYELRERLRRPKARGYPPRIFISYRRESAAHIAWCAALARELTDAGYAVLLDELELADPDPGPEDLARFVGKLASADVALVILTRKYMGDQAAKSVPRWIFEEWTRIATLRDMGLLEIVGVLRDGPLSSDLVELHNTVDRIIDLGNASDDRRPVLDFFRRYTGQRVSDADSERLAQAASGCIKAARTRDRAAAEAELGGIRDLRLTEEYLVAALSSRAAFRPGPDTARRVWRFRKSNPGLSSLAELATSLWIADLDVEAFAIMAEIVESRSLWRPRFHEIMAWILWDRGEWLAALNHLTWVVGYGRSGTDGRMALPEREDSHRRIDALRSRIAASGPTPDRQCDMCHAWFFSATSTCLLCGTQQASRAPDCHLCRYPVVSFGQLHFCPICRHEFRERALGRLTVRLVERRVGGLYSVLWPHARPGNWVIRDGVRSAY